jgi:hypothetical protein
MAQRDLAFATTLAVSCRLPFAFPALDSSRRLPACLPTCLAGAALPPRLLQDDSLVGYLEYMPGMLAQGMGKLAQVADPHDAAAQLRAEPIFCMETSE